MNGSLHILVTGGAGFIGSHLTDYLLKKGHKVTAIDNLRNGKVENLKTASAYANFNFIKGDILNPEFCKKATDNIDVVYHLACLGVRHSLHSPLENHEVNATGTLNVLEGARLNGVKHFFYISTSEVYGKTTNFPIKETDPTNPITVYGSSKLAGEHYTHSYNECFGLPSTVLRIFNNYGPRAHYEGDSGEVIPRSIVNLLYRKSPVIFGDGQVTRDFFYVKDTAKVLTELLDCKGIIGATFNIGTGKEITIRDLINTIIDLMPSMYKQDIHYLESRPADVPRLWVDNRKLKKLIKYSASCSFADGLQETIDYYTHLVKKKNLLEEVKVKNWESY